MTPQVITEIVWTETHTIIMIVGVYAVDRNVMKF